MEMRIVNKWQSIDGAPRDGQIIQVREGAWAPFHARWKDGRWEPIEYQGSWRPTHWLPKQA